MVSRCLQLGDLVDGAECPYDGPLPDHTEFFDRVADLAVSSLRLTTALCAAMQCAGSYQMRRLPRHVLLRSLATLWLTLAAWPTVNSIARADAVDDYVRSEMSKRRIPGLSLAVIRDDKVLKEAAYGVASVELGAPVTLDKSYPLASMTKIFTAAAIMQLVESGRISLDESVTKILPQLPAKWGAVTIRHCLSHTSGLPDILTDGINGTTISGDWDAALKALAKMPAQEPGERSVYNQTGYVLLWIGDRKDDRVELRGLC